KFTINGTTSIEASSGNGLTFIQIGNTSATEAGTVEFGGNVTVGASSALNTVTGFIGNPNSKMIFRGDLTLGKEAATDFLFSPGTVDFDGTSTQTVTWNNSVYYVSFTDVNIGNTN